MNSIEKIRRSLDAIEGFAGDETMPPTARMASSMLTMFRPRLEPMIPEDPGELDDLLGRLAEWALAQRSDEVPANG